MVILFIDIPTTRYLKEFPRRSLYARLSRIDFLSDRPYRRASFEFDGIDARSVDLATDVKKELFDGREFWSFGLVRIVTTPHRFSEVLGSPPVIGGWYHLELEPGVLHKGLMSWHAQLGPTGYYDQSRGSTISGSPLEDPLDPSDRPRARSLGAAASRQKLPQSIAELSKVATVSSDITVLEGILAQIQVPETIVVRDVGQACFTSFLTKDGDAYLHFDTGLPISFNGHTAPKSINVQPAKQQTVILSHFDWDHLHAPYSIPALLDAKWIVPSQKLGPGAARLALIIARRGGLHVWPAGHAYNSAAVSVAECSGTAGNVNDTGLAVVAKLASGKRALLTGDAAYSTLPAGFNKPVEYLVVSHHGAKCSGGLKGLPTPSGKFEKSVVSFGSRNVYRHPDLATKASHVSAGLRPWISTAADYPHYGRGDRYLK